MTSTAQQQTIEVWLSDGTHGQFVGPALVTLDADHRKVTAIRWGRPKDIECKKCKERKQ